MELFGKLVLGLAIIVAIVFSLLVLVTGKGDAMSGGGSVRTSFKGKASFDDIISKWTLYMGISFMSLVLLYTVVSNRIDAESGKISVSQDSPSTTPATKPTDANAPLADQKKPTEATNTPASDSNKPAEATNAPLADANTPL